MVARLSDKEKNSSNGMVKPLWHTTFINGARQAGIFFPIVATGPCAGNRDFRTGIPDMEAKPLNCKITKQKDPILHTAIATDALQRLQRAMRMAAI